MSMFLYFHQRERRKKKSVLGLWNLGKVLATAGVHDGGFSGYFSSLTRTISLCIFRLCFFLTSRDPPNHLHLHNVFRKPNLPLGSKKLFRQNLMPSSK